MARVRSPGYPNVGLGEAVDNARKIYDGDYTNPVTRETAARHMGYAGTTGTSDRAISALMHYGLLSRVSKGEIQVSDLAMEILFPENPEARARAVNEAGNKPSLFGRISEKFPDGRPSDHSLRNFLAREGFASAAVDPAIKSYLDTQQFIRQERVSESYGGSEFQGVESGNDGRKTEPDQMHSDISTTPKAPAPVVQAELNKINAEIRGETVFVSALLDKDGLDRLKKKIAALEDFLSD